MIVHQIYAQIFDETVQNIIVCDNYEMANYLARAVYGNEAFAVDCLQYPCQIGDKYRDGIFYSVNTETGAEKEIPYVPTQEQQVHSLQAQNESLTEELTNTQFALTEQYEKNIALEEAVTNTQLALTEMYEGMEV